MQSSVVQRANFLLAPALALCSWVSLNPYFFWGSNKHLVLAGLFAGVIAVIAFLNGDRPRKSEAIGFILMALFILYISFLPKTDGSLTRWYFVLPTMLALCVFEEKRRVAVVKAFSLIFAVSLLPGIIASLLCIIGINPEFGQRLLANPVMAADAIYYLHLPGVLLLGTNAAALPWGGEIYRLCAVYDEPGMVGTVAAFLLAANRFRINSLISAVILIGGLLSLSLAFVILVLLGFGARFVLTRSVKVLVPVALCVFTGMLAGGVIKLNVPAVKNSKYIVEAEIPERVPTPVLPAIAVKSPQASVVPQVAPAVTAEAAPAAPPVQAEGSNAIEAPAESSPATEPAIAVGTDELIPPPAVVEVAPSVETPAAAVASPGGTVRQDDYLNNRSLPEMQKLLNYYWAADIKTLLFGVSADASVVYGGVSQVVTRVFTDSGIIGMLLFASSMIFLAFAMVRRAQEPIWLLLFFGLFALSIYQRPVVWMPYAFTLFICGPAMAAVRESELFGGKKAVKPDPA